MAQGIGGGGYFANVNAQFAKDLAKGDGAAAQSARNNSGITAQNRKGAAPKNKVAGGEDSGGIALSDKAQQALQSEQSAHAEFVEDHGHELAHQAGVHDTSHEQADVRMQRGYERTQEELKEGDVPHGMVHLESPEGAPQLISLKDHDHLQKMDDPDHTDDRVLGDIPDANLHAANATVETQMAKGVSKVAQFKTDPKIDEVASEMEIEPRPMLTEPMGMAGPGNDKLSGPMTLDFPPEMERVAAEKAAHDLASGGEQEQFVAGLGGAGASFGAAAVGGAAALGGAAAARASAPAGTAKGAGPSAASAADGARATSGPAQAKLSPEMGGGPAEGDTRFHEAIFGGAPQPGFVNQGGRPQEPVKPSFFQRLKYLFTGGSQPPVGAWGPQNQGFYPTQAPPWGGQGPVGDPSQTLRSFQTMQNLNSVMMMGMVGLNDPLMGLMGMGMMLPSMMGMNNYYNMMPQQPWTVPPFPQGPGPMMPPWGMPQPVPGMGMPGMGMPGMGMPGAPGTGAPFPVQGAAAGQPASFMRYDPTPQKPGSVVILDSFQSNPQLGGAAPGELAAFAAGSAVGDVARCEMARPEPTGTGWILQPQHNTPPDMIRQQLSMELAGARCRSLEGATQNLKGLAAEGLKSSAVALPQAQSPASEVWGTYAGLREAWSNPGGNTQGSQVALGNYCRAFGLDAGRIMHPDRRIAEPERAKLQQALISLSSDVDKSPQVQQSQRNFQGAVSKLAEQKVSVVTVADSAEQALGVLADDRGDRDNSRPLSIPDNFAHGVFATAGTVSVGASLLDDKGQPMPGQTIGTGDRVHILADSSVKMQDGGTTSRYGAAPAAPRVANALAALHARYPEKSTGDVLKLLMEQGTDTTSEGGYKALNVARVQQLVS